MIVVRRMLVVLALMVWQGGFIFYGAVVVPITRAQVDQPLRGQITQRVTGWVNFIGTVALLPAFADVWAGTDPRKLWRWLTWAGMAAPHLALVLLHRELSRQMAATDFGESEMVGFRQWHWAYMAVAAVQCVVGLVFVVLMVRAWRAEDASEPEAQATG
jgi:hypothetical protein